MAEVLEVVGLCLYGIQILLSSTTCARSNDNHPYKQLSQW